jgi:hypothetical protein
VIQTSGDTAFGHHALEKRWWVGRL